MRGTMPWAMASRARSCGAHWLIGRPNYAGGVQASLRIPITCSSLKVGGTPRR